MERIECDLLFRWFVGIGIDGPMGDHSRFSKNCDRLLEERSPPSSWPRCCRSCGSSGCCRASIFGDGTLIEAWASLKSLKPMGPSGRRPAGGRSQYGG
jgi:hypothetical protein